MNVQEAQRKLITLASEMRYQLLDMGFGKIQKDGTANTVSFSRLLVDSVGQWGALEVNLARKPAGIRVAKMITDDSLHELTIRLSHRITKLNTTGITFAIELDPRETRKPLPRMVRLQNIPQRPYTIPIGYGHYGAEWRSLLETSHLLVGGESRSGKSTWLNATISALLARNKPDALKLALVDPKGVEFLYYQDLPHLYAPVITHPQPATELLQRLVAEMDRRQMLFTRLMARRLSIYNERAQTPLPLLVVVIDEITDIALQAGKEFQNALIRLASKGASFGIVLILATQNPKAEVLNTLIKGNLSTRIGFRVNEPSHSITVLGVAGAEKIPRTHRGRMMVRLDGDITELQGYWLDDKWILQLTNTLRGGKPITVRRETLVSAGLSDLERRMVRWAVRENDGEFQHARLYEVFGDQISKGKLTQLCRKWVAQDWLEKQRQGLPSQVTKKLLEELTKGEDDDRTIH